MTAQTLFYLIVFFLLIEFLIEKFLDNLNARHFRDPVPVELHDVYDLSAYKKSQDYKLANYKLDFWTSIIAFVILLAMLFFKAFAYLDQMVSNWTSNTFMQSLLFFAILFLLTSLLNLPVSYYKTFVIEEKFGFNKTTHKLYWIDQIKSFWLSLFLGGLLLSAFIGFYQWTGSNFWLYAWLFMVVFSLILNMFYTSLIVPLFNKLTPLPDGKLKEKLQNLADKTQYKLSAIYVIDGSKRSSKANAYFSGLGPKKKVVLYDTLIQDLTTDEITAVLAHEIGHYKHKHIIYNLLLSLLVTGIFLYLLSLMIDNSALAQVLGSPKPKFHLNLVAFILLFTPISFLIGIATNWVSRKFEYQADAYAKQYHNATDLVSGLKKLSAKSLSNLTPHPWYVIANYSHPTLLQRIKALNLSQK